MSEPRFIHLRIHSDFSMIDGLTKIEILVNKAVNLNMPALAITDFTNLFGFIKFYKLAHNLGIKPIIGADFYIGNEISNDEKSHITILAMNNVGYKNLTLLISKAYKRGYGIQGPWINRDWLINLNDGLLLISGAKDGDIGRSLLNGNNILVNHYLNFYQSYFPNRFYIELIRTGRINEENYLHMAVKLAKKHNLPVVATNDVRFADINDFYAHEVRVAISNGYTINNRKRLRKYSPWQYMRSEDEICKLFADIPEALKNSVEIAKRCNVTINFDKYHLPKFFTGNMTAENFLIKKSMDGLEERLKILFPNSKKREKKRLKYKERLENELKIINTMGFPGYFLIVMEFIQWSKDNDIFVGPGRGSGAGSLVAYTLKITDLDPLAFGLLFERFLNQERVSMPDLDIDFCMEKRDLVIKHVADKYGNESVSQIITFGTMTARAVIRDVGRVLEYPYSFIDRISKMVPSDSGITIDKAFEVEPQLLKSYKSDEEIKTLINVARRLEGVVRNASKHAGGVVISPTKITDFSPIYYDEKGQHPVTQFDKDDIEYIGLVKFDFLGLRTLTIIDLTLKMINEKRRKKGNTKLDINMIPLNDKQSFDVLRKSETNAVFQLESNGMKDLIKRLQPDCFEDIIALIALFRPGPLQSGMVDNFINRKHKREKISYPDVKWQHERLKPVLKNTYGIILYQEQVMQIAQVISGFTLGKADILRRAMAKKNLKEMAKQRLLFEEGAKKNGINSKLAIKIFSLVEKFANYGFNKSHSAAYALISYQTLWLKVHYPSEFMAAAMTADIDNTEKIVELINECWRMGIKVLKPDINYGLYHFYVNNNNEVVYGIGAIKGIGKVHIDTILEERNNGGYFSDLFNFCSRINMKKLNRRILEKLIMSGALDTLASNRSVLMNSLDDILKIVNQNTKTKISGQIDMFGDISKKSDEIKCSYNNHKVWSEKTLLDYEKDVLGLYLSGHPINHYMKDIELYTDIIKIKDINFINNNKLILVAGIIIDIKTVITKSGNPMIICVIDDNSGRIEVIFYNDIIDKYQQLIKKDNLIIVKGYPNTDNFSIKLKIITHEILDLNNINK